MREHSMNYRCPSCGARSRFNLIEQVATPVKIDPLSGEVIPLTEPEPFHLLYQGPRLRVQCATCGLVEDEIRFVRMAEQRGV